MHPAKCAAMVGCSTVRKVPTAVSVWRAKHKVDISVADRSVRIPEKGLVRFAEMMIETAGPGSLGRIVRDGADPVIVLEGVKVVGRKRRDRINRLCERAYPIRGDYVISERGSAIRICLPRAVAIRIIMGGQGVVDHRQSRRRISVDQIAEISLTHCRGGDSELKGPLLSKFVSLERDKEE